MKHLILAAALLLCACRQHEPDSGVVIEDTEAEAAWMTETIRLSETD